MLVAEVKGRERAFDHLHRCHQMLEAALLDSPNFPARRIPLPAIRSDQRCARRHLHASDQGRRERCLDPQDPIPNRGRSTAAERCGPRHRRWQRRKVHPSQPLAGPGGPKLRGPKRRLSQVRSAGRPRMSRVAGRRYYRTQPQRGPHRAACRYKIVPVGRYPKMEKGLAVAHQTLHLIGEANRDRTDDLYNAIIEIEATCASCFNPA